MVRSVGLVSGSPPPSRAATSTWRISLANSLPARLVGGALLVLDRGPLGMTGHRRLLLGDLARPQATALEEQLVQPGVVGQLRVERVPRAPAPGGSSTGSAVDLGQDLDAVADPLDDGRPDEHGVERRAVEPGDVEVGLERVDLAPEGVAPHVDVDGAEARAGRGDRRGPRRPAGSCPAQVPNAGSPLGQPLGQRLEQAVWPPAASTWWSTRRPAAPGRRPRRGRPGCGPRRRRRPSRVERPARARHAPCSARTPTVGPRWPDAGFDLAGPAPGGSLDREVATTTALTSPGRRAWCRACRSRGRAWPRPARGSPWPGCRGRR